MQNQIDMKGFIQIALVVDDIEKAAKKWAELFGVPVPPIRDDKPRHDPNLTYRGEEAYYGLKFAVIDCRERGFADELAEHDRIDRGVELLEKRSQHDRQEERQHPLQNGAFGHGALMEQRALHENSPFGANRKYLRSVDTIILIFRAFARGHGKYFRRKNFRESGLDETECFPYNKDEPHTIEHRGAGKPAEIAHRACPLT